MDTSGLNETYQIVRVTADGADRFYRISGEGLKTSGHIAKDMGKIMLLVMKQTKKSMEKTAAGGRLQAGEMPALQLFSQSESGVAGASVPAGSEADFSRYAAANRIPYAAADRSGDTVYVIYPADRHNDVKPFIRNAGGKTVSIQTYTGAYAQTPYNRDVTYTDIEPFMITGVNRDTRMVRISLSDRETLEVPASDVIKDKSRIRVRLREKSAYMHESPGGRIQTGGRQAAALITDTIDSERRTLGAQINRLKLSGYIDTAAAGQMLKNPFKYRRRVRSMAKRVSAGIRETGSTTVFRLGNTVKAVRQKTAQAAKEAVQTTAKAVQTTVQTAGRVVKR